MLAFAMVASVSAAPGRGGHGDWHGGGGYHYHGGYYRGGFYGGFDPFFSLYWGGYPYGGYYGGYDYAPVYPTYSEPVITPEPAPAPQPPSPAAPAFQAAPSPSYSAPRAGSNMAEANALFGR